MIRTAIRRLRTDDEGLSLTEVLVAAMMTLGIMAMIGTMFIQTARITSNSTQTTNSNNVAANVANELSGVIRVATTLPKTGAALPDPAIVAGNGESLTLYSLSNADPANPAPVRVKFTVDASRAVVEERCTATLVGGFWTFGTCATLTTRNLGGVIMPGAGNVQLFNYYTAGNLQLAAGGGSIAPLDLVKVASIKINVSVKAAGSTTGQVVIQNKVVLGNLGLDSGS